MAAKKKEIRKVAAPASAASLQKISNIFLPTKGKKTEMIAGGAADAAKELVKHLRDDARVL
jgi:electron transfer flavoprotein alpha/beta subunit